MREREGREKRREKLTHIAQTIAGVFFFFSRAPKLATVRVPVETPPDVKQ